MRLALLTLALVAAAAARAQDGWQLQAGPNGFDLRTGDGHVQPAQAQATLETASGYTLAFRPNPDGFTLVKVVGPFGARVRIFDQSELVTSDELPLACKALPDHVYRVAIRRRDGAVFEKRIRARSGMTATLFVGQAPPEVASWSGSPEPMAAPPPPPPPPPPMGPQPMADSDFAQLASAISAEPFPSNKIDVLRTAVPSAYFTCAQVGRLVDLYDFPNDKVKVVALTREHILDRQNGFTLYQHFAFPGDKDRVQRLLGG